MGEPDRRSRSLHEALHHVRALRAPGRRLDGVHLSGEQQGCEPHPGQGSPEPGVQGKVRWLFPPFEAAPKTAVRPGLKRYQSAGSSFRIAVPNCEGSVALVAVTVMVAGSPREAGARKRRE